MGERAIFTAGWMRPDGSVVDCGFLKHFEALAGESLLSSVYAAYTETVNRNRESVDEYIENLEPDEHVEMHRFEGMDDDAGSLLLAAAYDAGYIRLGYTERHALLEAEGYEAATRRRRSGLLRLAKDLEAACCIRVVAMSELGRGQRGMKLVGCETLGR